MILASQRHTPINSGPGVAAAHLLLGASATYRLTRLITEDEITRPLRERLWDRYPPESTAIGYLISCPHCVSIYAGAAVTGLAFIAASRAPLRFPAHLIIGTLALSGATSLYHEYRESSAR